MDRKYIFSEAPPLFESVNTLVLKVETKEGEHTLLAKVSAKQPPDEFTIESFKRDFQFSQTLYQKFPDYFLKMIKLIEEENSIFIIEEAEDIDLRQYLNKGKMELQDFLEKGIFMCKALFSLHSCNVIHRDIKTANFVLGSKTKQPKLIDFGVSTFVSRKLPSVPCTTPIGTYHYMRINQNVDSRSDIYSVGITFYELLTGKVPFTGDKLAIVHSQLTKKLPIIENVPKAVNDILQKMCAKNVSERYSSAFGVQKDLEFCLQHLQNIPDDFKVGSHDLKRFQIPNKIYGRIKEIETLRKIVETTEESTRMCLISGYSGSGKSKLIEEWSKTSKSKILVAHGKFDQFDKTTPYFGFIQVLKNLILKVSLEKNEISDSIVNQMKTTLQGEFGGVLKTLVPEIEILIGKQKDVPQLEKIEETQERLFNSFMAFFKCFTASHALILAMDDLQWCDAASFMLINKILEVRVENTFIIGAYRDNEVDSNHPLMVLFKQYDDIQKIHLIPLDLDNLNEMISDTLELPKDETKELSALIHKKTGGNPFFSREFIITLYEEELLSFKDNRWTWDLNKVEMKNFSTNIIDFMVKNLKKGSSSMQKILKYASCIGNTFNLTELNAIWDEEIDLLAVLLEPLSEGWILQNTSEEFKFLHDRLQQAAYELIDEQERQNIHLIIGTALLNDSKAKNQLKEKIHQIVNHLNISKKFDDKIELLHLTLNAADICLQNSAFKAALEYTSNALNLLPENSWETNYEDSFHAHEVHAKSCYGNTLLEEAENEYNLLLKHVQSRTQKLRIYSEYMKMASLSVQFDKGFLLLLDTFEMFDLTKNFPKDDMQACFGFIMGLKKKCEMEAEKIGGLKNILSLKKCENEEMKIFQTILAESLDIIFVSQIAPPLMPIVCPLLSVYLFLAHGLTDNAAVGLSVGAWGHAFFFTDPDAYQLSIAAEKLFNENQKNINVAIVQFALGLNQQYGGTLKQMLFYNDEGAKYAIANKEYVFGAYNMNIHSMTIAVNGQYYGKHLPQIKNYQKWLANVKNFFVHDMLENFVAFMSDLLGIKSYDPKFMIPVIRDLKLTRAIIPSVRGILHYLYNEENEALELFEKSESSLDDLSGVPLYYETILYHCLLLISKFKGTKDDKLMEKIQKFLEIYKKFSTIGDFFFTPRLQLLQIYLESTSTEANQYTILSSYEKLIDSSQKKGFFLIAGIASELMLDFSLEKQLPEGLCLHYFSNLTSLWANIGAKSKITKLKRKYYQFSRKTSQSLTNLFATSTTSQISEGSSSTTNENESLDMISVIKTSQALSSEIETSNLIKKVMNILIENMGAEKGVLIMMETQDRIKAISEGNNVVLMNEIASQHTHLYCSTLFDLVKMKKKQLIIDNAMQSEYSKSSYISKGNVKSLIIAPIIKGQKLMGIVQLENNSIEGAFTDSRKNVLVHITSQLAISYENANFYENIKSLNASYERFLPKEFFTQLGKDDIRKVKKGDSITKEISVLFTDIRNFTNITEKMNSKESFSFVNEILTYLAPVISANNGFIDKFFGDCIMALFPFNVDDSVKCGLELLSALDKYNIECRPTLKPVKIGIGIHYGNVMIGTIGDENRIDATVISDTVNTASRVESLTKSLKSTFVVTEAVIQNLSDSSIYNYRPIGKYLLKGKEKALKLYNITKDSKNTKEFSEAMRLFETQNFEKAKKMFNEIADPTSIYLQHVCDVYEHYSFPDTWEGEISIDKDGQLVTLNYKTTAQKIIENLNSDQESKITKKILDSKYLKELLVSMSHQNPDKLNEILSDLDL